MLFRSGTANQNIVHGGGRSLKDFSVSREGPDITASEPGAEKFNHSVCLPNIS